MQCDVHDDKPGCSCSGNISLIRSALGTTASSFSVYYHTGLDTPAVSGGSGELGNSADGGNGGAGGSGGWGGSGGAGAGGNGGPSIGIAFVNSPEANIATITFYQGASGKVGAAGNNAVPPSGAPCTSDPAELGTPGTVNDYVSFN